MASIEVSQRESEWQRVEYDQHLMESETDQLLRELDQKMRRLGEKFGGITEGWPFLL